MRKFICWIIGHRYRCLYHRLHEIGDVNDCVVTNWECQCCGKQDYQQWDT